MESDIQTIHNSTPLKQFVVQLRVFLWVHFTITYVRRRPFYFCILFGCIVILIGLFWPNIALRVILGKPKINEFFDKAITPSPLKEYRLLIGLENGAKTDDAIVQKIKDAHPHHSSCADEKACENFINRVSSPLLYKVLHKEMNFYLLMIGKIDTVYSYKLRTPFHHQYDEEIVNDVILPFMEYCRKHFDMVNGVAERLSVRLQRTEGGRNAVPKKQLMTMFTSAVVAAHHYLGLVPVMLHLTVAMVEQKDSGMRQIMSLSGLARAPYMLSWILVYLPAIFGFPLFGALINAASQDKPASREMGSVACFFLIFSTNILGSLVLLAQSLMVAAVFSRPRTVMFALLGIMVVQVIISMMLMTFQLKSAMRPESKHLEESLPVYTYLFASYIHTKTHIEISTGNTIYGTKLTFLFDFLMLAVHAVVYFVCAFYMDCVIPSGTGNVLPWNFPYLFMQRKCSKDIYLNHGPFADIDSSEEYQPVADPSKIKVRLRNISKTYKTGRCCNSSFFTAVQNVSLDIQEDEITALLGHNGAGKTTTFSIIMGILNASGGIIDIYGMNPSNHWEKMKISTLTSVCMQHDVLFDHLSVDEHMWLFSMLKGLNNVDFLTSTQDLITNLDLQYDRDIQACKLSGGQRRKLCVALALLGNPKIVLLDEPTSGVDPLSRRLIWNVLKRYKQNRIIILSTHFMDEADILADRKAIMVKGSVVCYGNSRFLKQAFGLGYIINFALSDGGSDTKRLQELVKKKAPNTQLNRIYGMEVAFQIPETEIEHLCVYLSTPEGEAELKLCNVDEYGVSVTKLEEIFFKLGEVDLDGPLEYEEEDARDFCNQLQKTTSIDWESTRNQLSNIDSKMDRDLVKDVLKAILEKLEPPPKPVKKKPINPILFFLRQYATLLSLYVVLALRNMGFLLMRCFCPLVGLSLAAAFYSVESSTAQIFPLKQSSWQRSFWPPFIHYKADNSKFEDLMKQANLLYEHNTTLVPVTADMKPNLMLNFTKWEEKKKTMYIIYNDLADISHGVLPVYNLVINSFYGTSKPGGKIISNYDTWLLRWVDSQHPTLTISSGFVYMVIFSAVFTFLSPLIAGDIIRDREIKTEPQMYLYGLKWFALWSARFTLHLIQYAFIFFLSYIFMFSCNNYLFIHPNSFKVYLLLYILATFATIMYTYLISFFFTKTTSGEIIFAFSILIPMFLYSVILFTPITSMSNLHLACLFFFPFVNPYQTMFFIDFAIRQQRQFRFQTFTNNYVPPSMDLFNLYIVWHSIIVHIVQIVLASAGMLMLHLWKYTKIFDRLKAKMTAKLESKILTQNKLLRNKSMEYTETLLATACDDLRLESDMVSYISSCDPADHPAQIGNVVGLASNLTKIYRTNTSIADSSSVTVAIDDVNFLLKAGEVFGLLGPAGSGKTTTLQCMSNAIKPTAGETKIWDGISGQFVSASYAAKSNLLGYCPQYNPIWNHITVEEHIQIYLTLRGVDIADEEKETKRLLKLVNLTYYAKTKAGALSGGCKRRLSMAISIVGDPLLVMFDEPSCGVDPKARRGLWSTISKSIHKTKRAAIITTHLFEECEALCNRLAIIVNGKMMCIGSPQQLKSKFGRGITLEIMVNVEDSNMSLSDISQEIGNLTSYLRSHYPNIEVAEEFSERITYRIPKKEAGTFGEIFQTIKKINTIMPLRDYTLSQPTLEQVYFDFARCQMQRAQNLETTDTR